VRLRNNNNAIKNTQPQHFCFTETTQITKPDAARSHTNHDTRVFRIANTKPEEFTQNDKKQNAVVG